MLMGTWIGLRAIESSDLRQLLEWRNRPESRRYFREFRELSIEQQHLWFDKTVLNDSRTLMFAIVEHSSGKLIGACGLCYIDWINRSADFSIYLGVDDIYIDDKLAVDAGTVMARYAFDELGLHRLWSEIYEFDSAKIKFFGLLGFELDGRHRSTHWSEGSWHNSLFYGLLEDDFRTGIGKR